jgi:hypothetical protein
VKSRSRTTRWSSIVAERRASPSPSFPWCLKAQRYKLTDDQIARLKEIDEDTPKLKKLLHKELSNLPRPTDASAVRAVHPESQAVQTYRKTIIQQCFDALDDKQRSLFGKELKRVSDGY